MPRYTRYTARYSRSRSRHGYNGSGRSRSHSPPPLCRTTVSPYEQRACRTRRHAAPARSPHERRARRRRSSSSSAVSRRRRRRRRNDSRSSSALARRSRSRSRRRRRRRESTAGSGSRVDADGHLVCRSGQRLKRGRFLVMGVLGEGTFGRVLHVRDSTNGSECALKVIRNVQKYRDAAELEINVFNKLDKLASHFPGRDLCVRLLESFDYHGHTCLSFPILGKSVYDFQKENGYSAYPLQHVRHMGRQLCAAVGYLHHIKLTHTDLKPENILLVNSAYDVLERGGSLVDSDCDSGTSSQSRRSSVRVLRSADIRLIDFGSATFDHEQHSTIVSTRHYRAPEVILELGWSQPCDVWSIGCILYEMCVGRTLFQTHDNAEHLAMMRRILGSLPSRLVRRSRTHLFDSDGRLCWNSESSSGRYVRSNCRRLCDSLPSSARTLLLPLLEDMLQYDPQRRIDVISALSHPFFSDCDSHSAALSPSR